MKNRRPTGGGKKMVGVACDPASNTRRGSNPTPAGKGAQTALKVVERWRDELVSQETVATPNVVERAYRSSSEKPLRLREGTTSPQARTQSA